MRPQSEEKRTRVLEATLRLLARDGPRAVTHRAVAAEAGCSLRATTYYFSSRGQLLSEALQHYADRALERFDGFTAVAPPTAGASDFVAAAAEMLARTVLSDLEQDRDGLVAEYELVLDISRNGTLEPRYAAWQERLLAMLRAHGEIMGSKDPAADARLVLATLRGLELEALAAPSRPLSRESLEQVFIRLLRALALLAEQ